MLSLVLHSLHSLFSVYYLVSDFVSSFFYFSFLYFSSNFILFYVIMAKESLWGVILYYTTRGSLNSWKWSCWQFVSLLTLTSYSFSNHLFVCYNVLYMPLFSYCTSNLVIVPQTGFKKLVKVQTTPIRLHRFLPLFLLPPQGEDLGSCGLCGENWKPNHTVYGKVILSIDPSFSS